MWEIEITKELIVHNTYITPKPRPISSLRNKN